MIPSGAPRKAWLPAGAPGGELPGSSPQVPPEGGRWLGGEAPHPKSTGNSLASRRGPQRAAPRRGPRRADVGGWSPPLPQNLQFRCVACLCVFQKARIWESGTSFLTSHYFDTKRFYEIPLKMQCSFQYLYGNGRLKSKRSRSIFQIVQLLLTPYKKNVPGIFLTVWYVHNAVFRLFPRMSNRPNLNLPDRQQFQ